MDSIKVSKSYTDNITEDEVHYKISRDQFMDNFNKEKLKYSDLLSGNVQNLEKFNLFIKKMRLVFEMEIQEMMTFLDEEGYKIEKIYPLLSYENLIQVKLEISHKYYYLDSIKTKIKEKL